MAGFVVSAAFKLVDQFSANADKIGAKADQLGSRMQRLKGKLSGFKGAAIGAIAGLLGGFSVKNLLKEGADEEQLVNRFVFAFDAAKGRIKTSATEMANFLKSVVQRTGVDMEDLQGAIVAPLLQASELSGKNLSRAIQASVDMARFAGKSTAEEFEGVGRALARAMQNPMKAALALRSVGIVMTAAQTENIKKLVKAGDIVGAQAKVLELIESRVGGFAAKNTIGKSLMSLNNVLGDLAASAGAFVHIIAGPAIQQLQTFLAPIAEEMNAMIKSINEGTSAWDAFGKTSNRTKAFIVGVVAIIGLMIAGIIGILIPVFSAIGAGLALIGSAGPAAAAVVVSLISAFVILKKAVTIDWAGLWAGFTAGVQTALNYVTSVYDKIVAIGGAFNSFMAAINPMNLFAGSQGTSSPKLDAGVGSKPANGEVQVNVKVSADPNTKASTDVSSVGSGLKVGRTSAGRFTSDPMPLAY